MAPTDVGLCKVYNGNSMKSTFADTKRMEDLRSSFDQRETFTPREVNGSGKIFQKTFWLDIGDRYSNNQSLMREDKSCKQ